MQPRIVWKIAGPMVVLGIVLLVLGVFAAWNVHDQHRRSSELIEREMRSMLKSFELYQEIREVRYQLNLFRRSGEREFLNAVETHHHASSKLVNETKELAHTDRELALIQAVEKGHDECYSAFDRITGELNAIPDAAPIPEMIQMELRQLSDDVQEKVLDPLHNYLLTAKNVVETSNAVSSETAEHLKIGFLVLGICGGLAGLMMGMGIARAVGRSIVQMNVSVRDAAGRLADVIGPVTLSHTGDLEGVESSLRRLESNISNVVQRLQQRETEVLRSEQLARVGQLAAGLAHEFRNPLMPMKVLVQSAIERGDGTGLTGRSLHVISEEISRLEKSIQSFLDFARPPTVEKTPVDITDVLAHTVRLVKGRAQQQFVELKVSAPKRAIIATIDQTQIRQLLLNLVLNALDALNEGGRIELSLDAEAPQPINGQLSLESVAASETNGRNPISRDPQSLIDTQRFQAPSPTGWFSIIISDNGPGIPPEMLPSIFEPFVTTKETGTGLGLSICRRIAEAHQGTLNAVNRPEGGASFILSLPYDL